MRRIKSFAIINITFLLVLMLINACLVDIPNPRPDGPSTIVYGRVLNDMNGPVRNAVISDGFNTTLTDNQGTYRMKTFPGAKHVFISVPEEFEIPMKDGMPQIFSQIDAERDSVNVNFILKRLESGVEKDFTLIALADPQTRNTTHLNRFKNETIPDINKTAKEYNTVYGITLGDLAFDSLKMLGDIKQTILTADIPFFHTIGNHDFSPVVYEPIVASKEFVSHFGPLDYSFNRGEVHFVVLNNVFNYGVTSYNWGFSEEQINWLKSDLKHVTKEKMLIVSVHVPVLPTSTIERKLDFLQAISGFSEVHILSGHWHANANYFDNNYNVYEHLTGTASGLWWSSTINKCGAPNGYGVYEISGNKMNNWYYKSVNHDKDYQVRMIEPNSLGDKDGYVVANVWNYDNTWKVELLEDGVSQGEMGRYTDYAPEVFALVKSLNISENTNWYMKTHNLFRMKPKSPDSELSIKVTDRFGNIYLQKTTVKSFNTLKKY